TGSHLRSLFAIILLHCHPVTPEQLWLEFCEHICDDLEYKLQHDEHVQNPSQEQVYDYGLH
ncbi:hypothetical protein BOTBODRAFT_88184, partial [Botryobasidium botryosum FD-172 SS1]